MAPESMTLADGAWVLPGAYVAVPVDGPQFEPAVDGRDSVGYDS